MDKFKELGINAHVTKAMREIGWTEPTPIQTEAIPAGIAGMDILAQAQTGTGKTGAYASIVLTNVAVSRRPSALILAPTRELACQIEEEIYKLTKHSGHSSTVVYGGASIDAQIRNIRKGTDIIVGTPGRLKDLINRNVLDLSYVSVVVLDEADRMLDMGFADELNFIMDHVPKKRQTLLFSATMAEGIKRLALKYMKERMDISVSKGEICSDLIEQCYLETSNAKKEAVLDAVLKKGCKAIVFCQTKRTCDKLYKNMSKDHIMDVIHGDIAQNKRERAIKRYRDGHVTVLIATDVAARGIDVNNIDCVINYDIPNDVETYLHRIGRTGRAGNKGIALSLVTKPEVRFISRCAREIGKTITDIDMDELRFNVKGSDEHTGPRMEMVPEEKRAVKKVHIPSVLRPHHAGDPKGMVSLKINLGKADGLSRLQVSNLIRDSASLGDASLGTIGLGQQTSYVEVSYDHVNTTLDALTGREYKGKKIFMSIAPKKTSFKNREAALRSSV
ncbi:MAG: DEAD/DEAH box helicase [Methanomassiliicoccaceae archaeon]|nr:DEAD/DEAH box helicase [Methanomassiliicoccaceae archaeon]